MKKIILPVILLMVITLCSCGSAEKTYEFITYSVPDGYSQNGQSEEPLLGNGSDYSFSIKIESPDVVDLDQMYQSRITSDEYTDVYKVDNNVEVDGISCEQFYSVDKTIDTSSLNVMFISHNSLVTISMNRIKADGSFPDDKLQEFENFLNRIKVEQ